MTRDEFDEGIKYLKASFPSWRENIPFEDLCYLELKGFHSWDWKRAYVDLSDGAYFPKKGQMKEAIRKAISDRIEKENQCRKEWERNEAEQFFKSMDGQKIFDRDRGKARQIFETIDLGSEAMFALAKQFERELNPKPIQEPKQDEVPF